MVPEGIVRSMKRGGVKEPWALLNAAGWKEGDSEEQTRDKLSEFQKHRKKHRRLKHLSGR